MPGVVVGDAVFKELLSDIFVTGGEIVNFFCKKVTGDGNGKSNQISLIDTLYQHRRWKDIEFRDRAAAFYIPEEGGFPFRLETTTIFLRFIIKEVIVEFNKILERLIRENINDCTNTEIVHGFEFVSSFVSKKNGKECFSVALKFNMQKYFAAREKIEKIEETDVTLSGVTLPAYSFPIDFRGVQFKQVRVLPDSDYRSYIFPNAGELQEGSVLAHRIEVPAIKGLPGRVTKPQVRTSPVKPISSFLLPPKRGNHPPPSKVAKSSRHSTLSSARNTPTLTLDDFGFKALPKEASKSQEAPEPVIADSSALIITTLSCPSSSLLPGQQQSGPFSFFPAGKLPSPEQQQLPEQQPPKPVSPSSEIIKTPSPSDSSNGSPSLDGVQIIVLDSDGDEPTLRLSPEEVSGSGEDVIVYETDTSDGEVGTPFDDISDYTTDKEGGNKEAPVVVDEIVSDDSSKLSPR